MEVTVTQFRKDMFSLLTKALEGEPISMTYKGKRLKVVAENVKPKSIWKRLTPLHIENPDVGPEAEEQMKRDMWAEIEADWKEI
jgi:antitoxin (DNA-binding transcriptional repressor) of toxin-antitoxin stability system